MSIDITSLNTQETHLREQLSFVIEQLQKTVKQTEFDCIISPNEVNNRHGTGVLIERIFGDNSKIISIRSQDNYNGLQEFGALQFCFAHQSHDFNLIRANIQANLKSYQLKRIISIPYYVDDVLSTIAIKDIFGVPLCTYIMDDQNIYVNNIPDIYMRELLAKSDLCFGISKSLCQAYEDKYQQKFWFFPPVAPEKLINKIPDELNHNQQSKHGIMVGNIWSQEWLNRLRIITKTARIKLDWYANPKIEWLQFDNNELAQDGIFLKGFLPESELIKPLQQASFALIPTAQIDSLADKIDIAKLSLPSRIPFIIATSHTPLIVMGNKDTAAAKFVEEFELGCVCNYDAQEFQEKVQWLTNPHQQNYIRHKAAYLAQFLSSENMADWIWQSLSQGKPYDTRFEKLGQLIEEATVVITPSEVNQKHGIGTLVTRLLHNTPNILSIRSQNNYGGEQNFGDISICLSQTAISRLQPFEIVSDSPPKNIVKQISPFQGFEFTSDSPPKNTVKQISPLPGISPLPCFEFVSDSLQENTVKQISRLQSVEFVSDSLPENTAKQISRLQAFEFVSDSLQKSTVKQIFCIPSTSNEVLLAIAVKELSNIPLVGYIIDDHNINSNDIANDLMAEFLSKCELRLTTNQDLRNAYEGKYNLKFWLLPPLIPENLVLSHAILPDASLLSEKRGVLLGSIASQQRFDMLCYTIRESGLKVDWYGNNCYDWLTQSSDDLINNQGITPYGILPEKELVAKLKEYPFVVIPTGSLDEYDDCQVLSKFSLPSRIIFALATSNIPIILLGSEKTQAGKFIKKFGIGIVCDYNPQLYRDAVDYIINPQVQENIRQKSVSIAQQFSAKNINQWLWQSVTKGNPLDLKFEKLGKFLPEATVVITASEINQRDEMGRLITKLLENTPNILSIRSQNNDEGKQNFGDISICLSQTDISRLQAFQFVSDSLQKSTVKQIFCIPSSSNEVLLAIAVKELSNIPLVSYIIDDHNINSNDIANDLMAEFFSKCELRLISNRELRKVYEEKYGLKFWLLPTVIPEDAGISDKTSSSITNQFSAQDINQWLWQSVNEGKPCDKRFEKLGHFLQEATVVITASEVNQKHGIGTLVTRLLHNTPNILSIRSQNNYGGEQDFGDISICLSKTNISRPQAFEFVSDSPPENTVKQISRFQSFEIVSDSPPENTVKQISRFQAFEFVSDSLQKSTVKQIFCIPSTSNEVLLAIAVKELSNIPLVGYIIDDHNINSNDIANDLMAEFFSKCELRLTTNADLRNAYQEKYNLKFWILPPLIPTELILFSPSLPRPSLLAAKRGVLLGSIPSQQRFNILCYTIRESGLKLDWYGNNCYDWLTQSSEDLINNQGITPYGILPEKELTAKLKEYPFVVIPAGSLDEYDDCQVLSKFSLPSRIIFALATSNTPIILLGSEETVAAKFINKFGIGIVCCYNPQLFCEAVDYITNPKIAEKFRQKASSIAYKFSAQDINQWLWQSLTEGKPFDTRFEKLGHFLQEATVVITASEVNQKHGIGTLVTRLLHNTPNILSIRSQNNYGGEQDFADISICLSETDISRLQAFEFVSDSLQKSTVKQISRLQAFEFVSDSLQKSTVKQIFCIPSTYNEVLLAIAVKELSNIPLVGYIIDDHNINSNDISDDLMAEFLSKCDLRLTTNADLRNAYEDKYALKFWILPPVIPPELVTLTPSFPQSNLMDEKRGVLLGSVASQQGFQILCYTIRESDLKLDWYGNNCYDWLTESTAYLINNHGITPYGILSESQLAEKLQQYPFVVIPTGTLDEDDDCQALSKFSLPSRIIFALATSNTPIILLGNEETVAAKFIKKFGIGIVCKYNSQLFQEAVNQITKPKTQEKMRAKAVSIAQQFSGENINQWLWQSLAEGKPLDLKFEKLFPREEKDLVHFIESPAPKDIYKNYVPVYYVMRRLQEQGYQPDFVLDVGSSHGIWSHTVSKVFSDTRFILIDPLMSKYEQQARDYYLKQIPHSTLLEIAISNQPGKTSFQVSPDLYGSSLLNPADFRTYETINVDVLTVDQVAHNCNISGRGLLKLDVQCAEHIVLEGAQEFLAQVDAIVVELSFVRYDSKALIFSEMLQLLDNLGFRYYDETDNWRSPVDGTLLQKEIVFLRKDFLVFQTSYNVE